MPAARRALVTGPVAVAIVATVCLGLATSAWLPSPSPPGPRAAGGEATVVRVVDGDTIVVDIGGAEETVRLIGIDTPETVHPDRPQECFGPEASERLRGLLPAGSSVRLARDVEPRDAYDRLLAYVERSADGLPVNLTLVTEGYAEASHHPPNTALRGDLDAAERAARRSGLGLWSACGR